MSVSALRFVPGSLRLTCCGLLLAAGTSRPTVRSRLLPPGKRLAASSLCTLNGRLSGLFGDLSRGRLLPMTGALLILPTRFEYDSAAGGAGSTLAGIAPGLFMGAGTTKGSVDELAWPPKMPVEEGTSS